MESDLIKTAIGVTGKILESVTPSVVSKLLASKRETKTSDVGDQQVLRFPNARGTIDRRRAGRDRRVGPAHMRLRKGFWLAFHRKTELGKFEAYPFSKNHQDDLICALIAEAVRYEFKDRSFNSTIDPAYVVEDAVKSVNLFWVNGDSMGPTRAVMLIDEVADRIESKFTVCKMDRRALLLRRLRKLA